MSDSLSNAFKTRMRNITSASSTRYKCTLHNGASRPTVSTTTYAASGLGELATTTNYTTGGAGLSGGIQLVSTQGTYSLQITDKVVTSAAGETIGPFDTVAVWDTTNSNELVGLLDKQASPQTASNGGTLTLDFPADWIAFSVA